MLRKNKSVPDLVRAGQYYDAESGLHYNWNRYYDPKVGRYVTVDPIGVIPGVGMSPTISRLIGKRLRPMPLNKRLLLGVNHSYSYVGNSPLRWRDPTGLVLETWEPDGGIDGDPISWGWPGDNLSGPNGNMFPGFKGQDDVCTLWIFSPIGDACFLGRCKRHDDCYADNQCNVSSFLSSLLGGTKSCNKCNSGFFSSHGASGSW